MLAVALRVAAGVGDQLQDAGHGGLQLDAGPAEGLALGAVIETAVGQHPVHVEYQQPNSAGFFQ